MRNYPVPNSANVSRVMRANRKSDTRPELALRSAMHRRGLRYRVGVSLQVAGVRVRPDVVFTRARVAVFLDGCFWHQCAQHGTSPAHNAAYWQPKLERNVERDRTTDALLTDAGWRVVRVWEHEPAALAAASIASIVGTPVAAA